MGASICLQQIPSEGTGVKVGFLSSSTHPYTASECYRSDSMPTSLVDMWISAVQKKDIALGGVQS